MNPLTNMKNVKKLSEQELQRNFKTSWHDQYRGSAWIFVGGLPYDLTEGDIIAVFSQYGEVVNINLIRDKDTGKQKGFCFICYEDQRSTDLAVDNFNGIKILGRIIRVDHVTDYKMPKDHKNADSETKKLQNEGCGPSVKPPSLPIPSTELPKFAKEEEAPPDGFRLPPRLPIGTIKIEKEETTPTKKVKSKKSKKNKKNKKKKSKKKHKKHASSSESSNSSSSSESSENSDSSDSENEEKQTKSKKQKHKDREEPKIKEERISEDRIPVEKYKNDDNKRDAKNTEISDYGNDYRQNRRDYDNFGKWNDQRKQNYNRDRNNDRRFNDRRGFNEYRNNWKYNNDRDRKFPNDRERDDRRRMNDDRDDRKRFNDRKDNRERDDSKRYKK